MKTADFDFFLPKEKIAQTRVTPYDHSKLLVYSRKDKTITDSYFYNIHSFLRPDDILVFNDTKVFKARIMGKKQDNSDIEILLLEPPNSIKSEYQCITKGKIHIGTKITFSKNLAGSIQSISENGTRTIIFSLQGEQLVRELKNVGTFPLPPYIKDNTTDEYQTVYADPQKEGSIAAPTAGFHFTNELLGKLREYGIVFEHITLDVGIGTFRPVKSDKVEEHTMHNEQYHIDKDTIKRLNTYKSQKRRIIAVGTTAVRTLEDSAGSEGKLLRTDNKTEIFIYPPYHFKFVDAIITNFHLPKSTLLMLICAFAGTEEMLAVYRHAVEHDYRFFSFGDATFIY